MPEQIKVPLPKFNRPAKPVMDIVDIEPAIPRLVDCGEYNDKPINVMIPVYEATPTLARTLWSIQTTTDMPLRVIVYAFKQSVAKNRNACIELAGDGLRCFADDDILLPPNWASKMAAVLANRKDVGVVAPRMTGTNLLAQNDLANVPAGEIRPCRPPGTLFMYDPTRMNGCAFDEGYIASQWEDTDFMRQIEVAGLTNVCTGDVWILHEMNLTQANGVVWNTNKEYYTKKWGVEENSCQN